MNTQAIESNETQPFTQLEAASAVESFIGGLLTGAKQLESADIEAMRLGAQWSVTDASKDAFEVFAKIVKADIAQRFNDESRARSRDATVSKTLKALRVGKYCNLIVEAGEGAENLTPSKARDLAMTEASNRVKAGEPVTKSKLVEVVTTRDKELGANKALAKELSEAHGPLTSIVKSCLNFEANKLEGYEPRDVAQAKELVADFREKLQGLKVTELPKEEKVKKPSVAELQALVEQLQAQIASDAA